MNHEQIGFAALGIIGFGFVAGLLAAWGLEFLGAAPYWVGLAQGSAQVAVTICGFIKS